MNPEEVGNLTLEESREEGEKVSYWKIFNSDNISH